MAPAKPDKRRAGIIVSPQALTVQRTEAFIALLAQHRHWDRRPKNRARRSGHDTRGAGPRE
jgi:hypothetical protein